MDVTSVLNGIEPHVTQLTRPGQGIEAVHDSRMAAWSPDGDKIAFLTTMLENYDQDIYIMDDDSSHVQHLYEIQNGGGSLQWFPVIELPYRFWLSFLPGLLLITIGWRWRA